MIQNTLEPKCIYDLLGESFEIPDYQRGYRWTSDQVTDLLNDIWEFQSSNKSKEEFYCLQPVVVVPLEGGKFSVVDGQQRLTTIRIIIEALRDRFDDDGYPGPFTLDYQTRFASTSFLNDLKNKTEEEASKDIDCFHIYEAYKTANSWFDTNKGTKGKFIDTLLSSDEIGSNVKVLWYVVNEVDTDPRKVFTRLNNGKIPLNNAELIKALFLNRQNFDNSKTPRKESALEFQKEVIRLRQLEISGEWDQMEQTLRAPNDLFWNFLDPPKPEIENRIELIFDLISGKSTSDQKDFTFRNFLLRFQEGAGIEFFWKEIKKKYLTLLEWYENHEYYHLIGFLLSTNDITLIELLNMSDQSSKSKFIENIKIRVSRKVSVEDIKTLNYEDHYGSIRNLLILYNILIVLAHKDESFRFPFGRLRNHGWDLEHIHATKSQMPNDAGHQLDWLREIEVNLLSRDDHKGILRRVSRYLKEKSPADREPFEKLYDDTLKIYSEDGKLSDIDDISNLALLDSTTNRSIKNSVFLIKRNSIIQKEREGIFIPSGTRNVFLKYYNKVLNQSSFWGKEDRDAYINHLEEVLSEYLNINSHE